MPPDNPHANKPVLVAGAPPGRSAAAMILVHGRGAGAADILSLSTALDRPEFTYLAPQAAGGTWYPFSFLSPMEKNQPGIDSGFGVIAELLANLALQGYSSERVFLLGFSQGACLVCEYAARNPRRYGGIAALSGGLIGPPGTPRDYPGDLQKTPIFLGCSDSDPHIPLERVHQTAETFRKLGGEVTEVIYPGMGHFVSRDEIDQVRLMMDRLAGQNGARE